MDSKHHLGKLQHAIMRVLWSEGSATVARVRDALAEEGDGRALTNSLMKLAALPQATMVIPGHGPATTLAEESRSNPYMRNACR